MANISKIKDPTEQQAAYQSTLTTLKDLITQYPATDVAVKLNTGQSIGNISIEGIEQNLHEATQKTRNQTAKKLYKNFIEWSEGWEKTIGVWQNEPSKVALEEYSAWVSSEPFLEQKQNIKDLIDNYSSTEYMTNPDYNLGSGDSLTNACKLIYQGLDDAEKRLPFDKLLMVSILHRRNAEREDISIDEKISELTQSTKLYQKAHKLLLESETLHAPVQRRWPVKIQPLEKDEMYLELKAALEKTIQEKVDAPSLALIDQIKTNLQEVEKTINSAEQVKLYYSVVETISKLKTEFPETTAAKSLLKSGRIDGIALSEQEIIQASNDSAAAPVVTELERDLKKVNSTDNPDELIKLYDNVLVLMDKLEADHPDSNTARSFKSSGSIAGTSRPELKQAKIDAPTKSLLSTFDQKLIQVRTETDAKKKTELYDEILALTRTIENDHPNSAAALGLKNDGRISGVDVSTIIASQKNAPVPPLLEKARSLEQRANAATDQKQKSALYDEAIAVLDSIIKDYPESTYAKELSAGLDAAGVNRKALLEARADVEWLPAVNTITSLITEGDQLTNPKERLAKYEAANVEAQKIITQAPNSSTAQRLQSGESIADVQLYAIDQKISQAKREVEQYILENELLLGEWRMSVDCFGKRKSEVVKYFLKFIKGVNGTYEGVMQMTRDNLNPPFHHWEGQANYNAVVLSIDNIELKNKGMIIGKGNEHLPKRIQGSMDETYSKLIVKSNQLPNNCSNNFVFIKQKSPFAVQPLQQETANSLSQLPLQLPEENIPGKSPSERNTSLKSYMLAKSEKSGVQIQAMSTDGNWCKPTLDLYVIVSDHSTFESGLIDKYMTHIGGQLKDRCPTASQAKLSGFVGDEASAVFEATSSSDNQWQLKQQ